MKLNDSDKELLDLIFTLAQDSTSQSIRRTMSNSYGSQKQYIERQSQITRLEIRLNRFISINNETEKTV